MYTNDLSQPCSQMTSVSQAHKYSLTSVSHHLASNTPASGVMLVKSNHDIRISTQPTVCFGPNTVARVDVSACFPCVPACARACLRACVRACVRASVRVCVRLCMHVCVRYIHIYYEKVQLGNTECETSCRPDSLVFCPRSPFPLPLV